MVNLEKMDVIVDLIEKEFISAEEKHGPFHSAHEGYAVLLEEVDELWQQVMLKRANRNKGNMQTECIQIAAMALRFYHDLL